MIPKTIGIVGGAGPMAGVSLLDRLLRNAMSIYGCHKDADFPKVILLSFPFTEMLTPDTDVNQVKRELKECLNQLRANGASVIAIACNTLHAFLDEDTSDLVLLPEMISREITDEPLVLCTSTSVRFGLHKKYFSCVYPEFQDELDEIIDRILKGEEVLEDLLNLLQDQPAKTIVLGCTELSLYTDRLSTLNKTIIDPLNLVANELLKISFKGEKSC